MVLMSLGQVLGLAPDMTKVFVNTLCYSVSQVCFLEHWVVKTHLQAGGAGFVRYLSYLLDGAWMKDSGWTQGRHFFGLQISSVENETMQADLLLWGYTNGVLTKNQSAKFHLFVRNRCEIMGLPRVQHHEKKPCYLVVLEWLSSGSEILRET